MNPTIESSGYMESKQVFRIIRQDSGIRGILEKHKGFIETFLLSHNKYNLSNMF